jgi:peroxiredoxin
VKEMPKEDKGLKPGSPIPTFALTDVNGKLFTFKQYLGQTYLIYFLRGTW